MLAAALSYCKTVATTNQDKRQVDTALTLTDEMNQGPAHSLCTRGSRQLFHTSGEALTSPFAA